MKEECGIQDPISKQTKACPRDYTDPQGLLAGLVTVHVEADAGGVLSAALEAATTVACYVPGRFVECPLGRRTHILTPDETPEHLACTLLGSSECVPCVGGELVLGQWQSVMLVDLDGPRARTVGIQCLGF